MVNDKPTKYTSARESATFGTLVRAGRITIMAQCTRAQYVLLIPRSLPAVHIGHQVIVRVNPFFVLHIRAVLKEGDTVILQILVTVLKLRSPAKLQS